LHDRFTIVTEAAAMDLVLDETIAALASPPGGGARGIVRLSGPQVRTVLTGWFEPADARRWLDARTAAVHPGQLALPGSRGVRVPVQVFLWPTERSYTGQPLAELHLPGSPPLLETILSETHRRGARPARPGEFTLRAFLAGRLDLLQAEAVLGVIDAHDHRELQTALAQLAGGLSGRLSALRRDLLELLADLEAGLDFIEEDIEFVTRCELVARVALARRFVDDLLQQSTDRMQSRGRPRVVLAGLPNAGKSTLFNRLTGREAALVSEQQGTTRDFLVAQVDWQGLSFDLVDTAGWEDGATNIAGDAQRHRAEQLQQADVLLWCSAVNLEPDERDTDEQLFTLASRQSRSVLRVFTQWDRVDPARWAGCVASADDIDLPRQIVPEISAVTGEGLGDLAEILRQNLASSGGAARQWLGMTAARCRESLEAVSAALTRAETAVESMFLGDELIAVDIREALEHLGVILGVVYTDDILDRVFSKFCIGK
jgi:tRNA modification GTPase